MPTSSLFFLFFCHCQQHESSPQKNGVKTRRAVDGPISLYSGLRRGIYYGAHEARLPGTRSSCHAQSFQHPVLRSEASPGTLLPLCFPTLARPLCCCFLWTSFTMPPVGLIPSCRVSIADNPRLLLAEVRLIVGSPRPSHPLLPATHAYTRLLHLSVALQLLSGGSIDVQSLGLSSRISPHLQR